MPAPTLTQLSPADPALLDRIRAVRATVGKRAVILTHHYQRPELVRLGDIRGDSFELSREAARVDAEIIVFCGVHFMAEAAAVLCRPDQAVVMPDWTAGCPMADMGPAGVVEQAWARIMNALGNETGILPLTYMNSAAAVKSFCGLRGGAVCTSSNAERAIGWALSERPRVLFVPDEHLGRNTAHTLGLKDEDVVLYRPRQPDGGLTDEQILRARLILWQGYCHVHTHFKVEHVAAARETHPGARVIVHPECRREVVAVADGSGSTRYLVDEVARAAPGSCTVVGTELNLVTRLAEEHPDRTVVPLSPSICTTMMRVEAEDLLHTLEHLDTVPRVIVAPDVAVGARAALDRMLALP